MYGKLQLYADDGVITYKCKNSEEMEFFMQSDLNKISEWFKSNFLFLNASKTVFMIFKQPTISIRLFVDDSEIQKVLCVKYLGLYIEYNLKWQKHVSELCKKISSICFVLRRSRNFISENVAWQIYYAHVLSHLTYMNSIWGNAPQNTLRPLQVLQNKVLKIIKKLPLLHPTYLLYDNKTLSLKGLYFYEILNFIYKVKNNLIKCNIDLRLVSDMHQQNTRSRQNFYISAVQNNLSFKNVFNLGPIIFNTLPAGLKNEESYIIFKRELKKYINLNLSNLTNFYL